MKVKLVAKMDMKYHMILWKVLPEAGGPVRERAVLVNKNTEKLSTVDSQHVDKSTFCDMLTFDIPTVYLSTVYFYTPPRRPVFLRLP